MSILVSQLWDVSRDNEGMDKVAALTEDYIRDRIRETSVCNRVIPPVVVTEATIERNTANDWPLKRVELEPDSKAFTLGFRGKGSAQFMEGRKYEVYFTKIETEHFKKTREEMMTMRYPVMDVVNNNFVLDMQEQVDKLFRARLDAAVTAATSIDAKYTHADTSMTTAALVATNFKDACLEGLGAILGKRRRSARFIMTEKTWLNLARLGVDKLGYDAVARVAFNGTSAEKTFLGQEVITTINSEGAGSVWANNRIYCVSEPGFLGSNFILGDVQQEMKREGNMIEWYDWADQGMEIGNIFSCSVITLGSFFAA